MCFPLPLILTIASTAMSVMGTLKQGAAQENAYKYQAEMDTREAAATRDEAKARAEKIRKLAKLQGGEATAALAASGVSVAEGTALVIDKDIQQRGEQDAFTEMLSGDRTARNLEAGAGMNRAAAVNVKTGSILSAGAQIADGWIRAKNVIKKPEQPTIQSGALRIN